MRRRLVIGGDGGVDNMLRQTVPDFDMSGNQAIETCCSHRGPAVVEWLTQRRLGV